MKSTSGALLVAALLGGIGIPHMARFLAEHLH